MNRMNRLSDRLHDAAEGPQIVAVASGKGGVGKSVIALNLADHLARQARVLLIDGDFQTGNLHLLVNLAPEQNWQKACQGEIRLDEAIIEISSGLHYLASGSDTIGGGIPDIKSLANFLAGLRDRCRRYDYIIIDTASGILPHTTLILHSADKIILVVTPELTAISDGYALYKTLISNDKQASISVLVNCQDIPEEAEYIFDKFTAVTGQFLGHSPAFLGSLGRDHSLVEAIASQNLVSRHAPDSRINSQLADLAGRLTGCRKDIFFAPDRINTTALRADIKE